MQNTAFVLRDLWIKQVNITHRTALVRLQDFVVGICLWHIPSAVLSSIFGLNGFPIFPFVTCRLHCWWQHPFPDTQVCLLKEILGLFESSCLTQSVWVYTIIFFLPNISQIPILSVTVAQNVHICWFPYDDLLYSTTTNPTPYASLLSMV